MSTIKLEKIDVMGNVIQTIELDGRWISTTENDIAIITPKHIIAISPNLEKIQTKFIDNL